MSGRGKGKSAKKAVSRSAKAGLQVRGGLQNSASRLSLQEQTPLISERL